MDNTKIEQLARETLQRVGYPENETPIDIISVARKMGFAVGNALLNEDYDGFIIVDEGKKTILDIETDKLIGVNSDRKLEWKRFIIAHEIGHYVFDCLEQNVRSLYAHREHRKGHDGHENNIDFFASNLLMPRESFIRVFKELSKSIKTKQTLINALAEQFVVTPLMAERRVRELNLE